MIAVSVTDEVCATLRELRLLDSDCERLVFGARASTTGIVLVASEEDLDELIDYVAAEANHETRGGLASVTDHDGTL